MQTTRKLRCYLHLPVGHLQNIIYNYSTCVATFVLLPNGNSDTNREFIVIFSDIIW
jgi:hypothetical protein